MHDPIFSALAHLDAAIVPLSEVEITTAAELALTGREVPALAREARALSSAIIGDRLKVAALERGIIDGLDRTGLDVEA